MSATNAFELDLANLIFCNINIAGLGDATGIRGSSAPGVLWLSLHTADPTEAGAQNASEVTYTGYARVSVVRSTGGWTVSQASGVTSAANAAGVVFPTSTGGSMTATHFGIGPDPTGAGSQKFFGPLTTPLSIITGVTPAYAAGALVTNID